MSKAVESLNNEKELTSIQDTQRTANRTRDEHVDTVEKYHYVQSTVDQFLVRHFTYLVQI